VQVPVPRLARGWRAAPHLLEQQRRAKFKGYGEPVHKGSRATCKALYRLLAIKQLTYYTTQARRDL
jgi:hypothetical protein